MQDSKIAWNNGLREALLKEILFVPPGDPVQNDIHPFSNRYTVNHAAELEVVNGKLLCDRDRMELDYHIYTPQTLSFNSQLCNA